MATNLAIKQLEKRNVASEITLMVWSDRMDLVALANVKGEVALHRLTWTKAWNLSPPKEGLCVKQIAWRPDGKIISIGYSSGQVLLVKVEDKTILHLIDSEDSDITCLYWIQEKNTTDLVNYMKYIDLSDKYLPKVSNHSLELDSSSDENQKCHLLQEQTEFNLLLLGTAEGLVHISIFGCFPCTILNLETYLGRKCSIESIHLTEDLSKTFITVKDLNNNIGIILLNSNILQTHMQELFAIALKRVKLMALINHISNTITSITEAWESILLEMDNKLSNYASKVAEGGVTADFLDLLMFGICSEEMKDFLIHDLTKKGLEKFGQTIEISYTSIQSLLLKYVMKFGQSITYHLAELRGMARLEHRYKILGLTENTITETIHSNGSFLIKCSEMQEIINHSVINYKAFFRWLYTAIMHLSDEPIPNDIPKMTQQDLAYIADFLQNFDNIGSNNSTGFVMERLGQYLVDAPLKIPPNMRGNDWTQLLTQCQTLKEHPTILKHYENMSLIQQFKHLKNSIDNIFTMPKDIMKEQFTIFKAVHCFSNSSELKMSHINLSKDVILFAFLIPPNKISVLKIQIDAQNTLLGGVNFHFSQTDEFEDNYNVVDLKFYSNVILSVLLQDSSTSKSSILYQLPLYAVLDKFSECNNNENEIFENNEIYNVNGLSLVPKLYKNIEGMVGLQFAVSGSRKVGIVLAENRRKVKLFEMEGEEEEEEDAEMCNVSVKDVDNSG